MLEDELLKWKLRQGSPDALARVYKKYIDSMLTLATGLLNNRAAAEDVVQDVFLSFARSARGLRSRGSLRSYLMTGVLNRVRDRRRQLQRQAGRSDPPGSAVSESAGPQHAAILAEEIARLNQALAGLPEEQREVVLLRLKTNMKFRDIARLQQTSLGTVLGRYRYGLDRLRLYGLGQIRRRYPLGATDRTELLGRQLIPGTTAGAEQVIVILVGAIAQVVTAEKGPEPLDRIELGAVRRQGQQNDVGGDPQALGQVPAGLVQHQHYLDLRSYVFADES
jgi:RNA polymerase sigma-70 factor (ECF subfamily)